MGLLQRKLLFSLFLIVVLLCTVIHFIWLDKFPPGMYHDEIEYILSSKSYALHGTDLSGIGFPLSLFKTETLGKISPMPPILLSPIWLVVPLTQTTAKLPYDILILLSSGILGYFSFSLFRNKHLSYITTLLFLINPWAFFLSRLTFEATFSLFFFLLGIVLLIKWHGWKLLIAFLLFILGFFSYNAAKLVIVPVVVVCLVYRLFAKKNRKLPLEEIAFFVGIFIVAIAYIVISKEIPNSILVSRSNELVFLDTNTLSSTVNEFRKLSIAVPFAGLFINKVTVAISLFLQNYFAAFSPTVLFTSGDGVSITSFYYHGLLYLFDFPLLLIGGFTMMRKYKKEGLFLFALLLVSPFATASSHLGSSIVFRSFLMLPILLLFSSFGLYQLHLWLGQKITSVVSASLLSLIIVMSFLSFLFLYFFRMPVFEQESFQTSSRVLAKYISYVGNQTLYIITTDPRETYLEAVFYQPQNVQNKLLENNKDFLAGKYVIGNTIITSACPKTIIPGADYILLGPYKCLSSTKFKSFIINRKDSGQVYKLYKDTVCQDVSLSGWTDNKFSDYAIEKMDRQTFCSRWIMKNL